MIIAMIEKETCKIHYFQSDSDFRLIQVRIELEDLSSQKLDELNASANTIHIDPKFTSHKKRQSLIKAEMIRVLTPIFGSELEFDGEKYHLAGLIDVP
jgi:hypothetical protein